MISRISIITHFVKQSFSKALNMISNIIILLYLSLNHGSEIVGVWGTLIEWIILWQVFLMFGSNLNLNERSAVYYKNKNLKKIRHILGSATFSNFFNWIIFSVVGVIILCSDLYSLNKYIIYALFISIIPILLRTIGPVLNGIGMPVTSDFFSFSFPSFIVMILIIFSDYFFNIFSDDIMISFIIVSYAISLIFSILFLIKKSVTPNLNFKQFFYLRDYFSFFVTILNTLSFRIDLLILTFIASFDIIGIYTIPFRIALLASVINRLIISMTVYRFAQLKTDDNYLNSQNFKTISSVYLRISLLFSIIFLFTICLLGNKILQYWNIFDTKIYICLIVLTLSNLFYVISSLQYSFLLAHKEYIWLSKFYSFSVLISIILCLILYNIFDLVGLSIGVLTGSIFFTFFKISYIRNKYKINFFKL